MTDTFKGIVTADGKKRQLPYRNILEIPISDPSLNVEGGFADSAVVGKKFKKTDDDIASLKEDTDNLEDAMVSGEHIRNTPIWESGSYVLKIGEVPTKVGMSNRKRSSLTLKENASISVQNGYKIVICLLNSDGTCANSGITITSSKNCAAGKYACVFSKNDDSDLTNINPNDFITGIDRETQISKNSRKIKEISLDISNLTDSINSGIKTLYIPWTNGSLTGFVVGQTIKIVTGYDDIRKYVFLDATEMLSVSISDGYTLTVATITEDNVCISLKTYTNTSNVLQKGRYAIVFKENNNANITDLDANNKAEFLLKISFGGLLEEVKSIKCTKWEYALNDVLCIGDSLTEGDYYGNDWTERPEYGHVLKQNYPNFLSRILSCNVTNAGISGATPITWYNAQVSKLNFNDYDSFIIWLGTNKGLTDTLQSDVIDHKNAGEDYNNFAETNTGYYCKIIEKIKADNQDAFIVLLTTFAGAEHDPVADSEVIRKIAELYELLVIDMSDLTISNYPELHGNVRNIHFSKAGNIFIADRICQNLKSIFNANPSLVEYGLSQGTRNAVYEH